MVYKQQPTLTFQEGEFQFQSNQHTPQSNQQTPLVYNPPKQSAVLSNQRTATQSHTQSVLNKLIGHEPCIHTLNYLEAQVESQKQIGKSQSEQLNAM